VRRANFYRFLLPKSEDLVPSNKLYPGLARKSILQIHSHLMDLICFLEECFCRFKMTLYFLRLVLPLLAFFFRGSKNHRFQSTPIICAVFSSARHYNYGLGAGLLFGESTLSVNLTKDRMTDLNSESYCRRCSYGWLLVKNRSELIVRQFCYGIAKG
jgi:hypothetical protein